MKMNSWMNNPDFGFFMAHSGWAWALGITLFLFFGWWGLAPFVVLGVAAAAVKEYWYDANYELPHQTWKDNTLDFSAYLVGLTLAVASALVYHYTRRS